MCTSAVFAVCFLAVSRGIELKVQYFNFPLFWISMLEKLTKREKKAQCLCMCMKDIMFLS